MAVAPRSFWKGHLRLALVTIPVRLVSATETPKTVLHQVDRKSRQRIRYQKVTAEDQTVVDSEDIVRGVDLGGGEYVLVEDDELEALKLDTRHTIELTSFVDRCEIEPLYFERPYYLLPDGDVAEEGYSVIREALRAAKVAGIGQLTMRGRENLVCMVPSGEGLVVDTLRYEDEIRDAAGIFAGLGQTSLRPDLIAMARQLIDERTTEFDASRYHDRYAEALSELIRTKAETGGKVAVAAGRETGPSPGTVVDFMEALRKSVGQAGKGGSSSRPKGSSAAGSGKSGGSATPAKSRTAAAASREPVKKSPRDGPKPKQKS